MQRSGLWAPELAAEGKARVPTAGEMLQALTDAGVDGAKYDAELPGRQRATLY